MPVVVNDFEVVNAPPAEHAPAAPEHPPPAAADPAQVEDELARSLRHRHTRAARLHAC